MKAFFVYPLGVGLCTILVSGCSSTRSKVSVVDVQEERHYDERLDYSDVIRASESLSRRIIQSDFLGMEKAPPALMFSEIRNKTYDHLDTKNIGDKLRNHLFQSGKVTIFKNDHGVNPRERKSDQGGGHSKSPEYVLMGEVREMKSQSPDQVRVSRKKTSYYQISLEIIHLESNELVWAGAEEFAREISEPLIRW